MQNNCQSSDLRQSGYRQLPSTSLSLDESTNNCILSSESRSVSPFDSVMNSMSESKYSKVIFSEISESYATDADIECHFYIGDAVKPSDDDIIALFVVGSTQVLASKKVSECLTDNEFGEKKIKFNAVELPKSTEEFFQFFYMTADNDICGASTPFKFIRPHDEDLIQLENNKNSDEEDFVVVRSQQALLQERIQQLVNENGVLEYSKRSLEQLINSKNNEISELKKVIAEYEDKIKTSEMEAKRVINKLKESEEQNRTQTEYIEAFETEIKNLRKNQNDYHLRADVHKQEMLRITDNYEAKVSAMEQMIKTADQEVVNMNRMSTDMQVLIEELSSSKAMVEAKLELSSTSIAKVMSERRDLDSENRMLRNELEDFKAKCDSLQSKTDLMMTEILDFDKIKLKSKVQIKTMSEELAEMKKQLTETIDTQKTMSNDWKLNEEKLENQIQEMKLRLANAAEEYEKLYKYNVKLENRIDKIKNKVKKYFETKTQIKSAPNVSPTERHELMARAETEVKIVMENETDSTLLGATASIREETNESIRIIQMPCILCNEEIPCISRDSKPMVQHLEDKHKQRLCPVCSTPFDLTLPGHKNYFEMHVDSHFDPRYPEITPPPMVP